MCSDYPDGRCRDEALEVGAEERDRRNADLEEARSAQCAAAAEQHPWAYDATEGYYGRPR
ncbi:hypothetical protein GCM10011492_44630 [Flexivirga endophytica]|jgi:hypothetical protein|uniref:Uncharacterized protein n=1 Tax=Flexivirga endophytica TaxID=1849103 RepID=A0A916TK36_9MICO|nr:hypothetical protein [Flexivirga endophytica]GGB48441.1 hypothetical protein GCM10011492_44630 [Flexivirga endophytica]GHB71426.1 hypothetical protein GCM10008112_44640 [Flexivirga endophytica]